MEMKSFLKIVLAILLATSSSIALTPKKAFASDTNTGFFFGGAGYEHVLFFNGPIELGRTTIDFRRAMRQADISLLVLSSPGGSLEEGMLFAETLHDLGINTAVLENEFCASACALVFFAGRERLLEGRVGVHQFQSVDGEASESETQWTVADLIQVLSRFEVPITVLERMLQTPPDQMFWFDSRSAALFSRSTGVPETALLRRDSDRAVDLSQNIRAVQSELNRVGCSLGPADGIVGPRSRAALEEYSQRAGIAFDLQNFERSGFLRILQETQGRVCPAPPARPQVDLSGTWSAINTCSTSPSSIQATITVIRRDTTVFDFITESAMGRASGLLRHSEGRVTGTLIENANGQEVRSIYRVTVSGGGSRMSGNTTAIFLNGERLGGGIRCSFSAVRN